MSNNAKKILPYGRQCIEDDDIAAVAAVLRSDYLTTGPVVDAFEGAFAECVGARHAVAVSSGTAALHLTALAAGLGEGDVAIVPAVTFLATANAARYAGAEVVFADVDPDSGLMTPETFEDATGRAQGKTLRAVLTTKSVLALLDENYRTFCSLNGVVRRSLTLRRPQRPAR